LISHVELLPQIMNSVWWSVFCVFTVYVPEPNFLTRELRKLPILHDEEFAHRHLTADHYQDTLAMP